VQRVFTGWRDSTQGLCFLNRWVLVLLLAVMATLVAVNVFARYAA
jgi:TRAP-type C4-dicarboxylate transport system permease small subunit